MRTTRGVFTSVATLLLVTCAAVGLEPEQVAVVANARSKDSVELAKLYCSIREIPEEHIIEIDVPVRPMISRAAYESEILQPVRQALVERELQSKIRCLALIWGVPVTVAAPQETDALNEYRVAAERAHYRLELAYELAPSVTRDFPEPRTNGLAPLGKLFAEPLPEVREPLMELSTLLEDLDRLLKDRSRRAGSLEDPHRRSVANRQLLALHMEVGGLSGLLEYIRSRDVADAPPAEALEGQIAELREKLSGLTTQPSDAQSVKQQLELMDRLGGAAAVAQYASQRAEQLSPDPNSSAAVDSELALLWWGNYQLERWGENPLHLRIRRHLQQQGQQAPPTLLTARIDGPSPEDVRRIIRVSHQVEQEGLRGVFYIDADLEDSRNPKFDELFKALHQIVRNGTDMDVVLDTRHTVFQPGECPDAALYTGWYKLRQYVPAFTWVPGAVGYHVASFEAKNLRNPDTPEWCAKMIQNGVVATIGAVDEPYLGAFPRPDEFFPLLLTGELTVAECYWLTSPTVSWRMTLIADPLYNPFKNNPQLKVEDLPPQLRPDGGAGSRPAGTAQPAPSGN
ncbi:MAG: TIGR03790 family protein [Phycisphaerae bacterium]